MANEHDSFDTTYAARVEERVRIAEQEERLREEEEEAKLTRQVTEAKRREEASQQAQSEADVASQLDLSRGEEQTLEDFGDPTEEPAALSPADAGDIAEEGEELTPVETDEDLAGEDFEEAEAVDETNIFGDIATGFLGGIRDAGVNILQTVADLASLGQADVNFDEMMPDFEEREGLAHGFVRSTTQFLTAFLPALGAMRGLASISRISKALAVGREQMATRALTGNFAMNIGAGAVSDFAVFNPQEARFADMLESLDISNPVTDFLSVDPDDTAMEGRLKNVIEGAGLGAVGDIIFKGIRASRDPKALWDDMIRGDVNPHVANAYKDIEDRVMVGRQGLAEAKRVRDLAVQASTGAPNPGIAAARAAELDKQTLYNDLLEIEGEITLRKKRGGKAPELREALKELQIRKESIESGIRYLDGAEAQGRSFDEYVAAEEADAAASQPLKDMRAADPEKSLGVEEGLAAMNKAADTKVANATKVVEEAEMAYRDFHKTVAYRSPKTKDLRERHDKMMDEYGFPESAEEVKAIHLAIDAKTGTTVAQERAQARVVSVGAGRKVDADIDEAIPGGATPVGPDFGKAGAEGGKIVEGTRGIFNIHEDGTYTVNGVELGRVNKEKAEKGILNTAVAFDPKDRQLVDMMTRIFVNRKHRATKQDVENMTKIWHANPYNARKATTPNGLTLAVAEIHGKLAELYPENLRPRKQKDTERAGRKLVQAWGVKYGETDPDHVEAVMKRLIDLGGGFENADLTISTVMTMEETAVRQIDKMADDILMDQAGAVTQFDFMGYVQSLATIMRVRDGIAHELGAGLSMMKKRSTAVQISQATVARTNDIPIDQFMMAIEGMPIKEMATTMKALSGSGRQGMKKAIRQIEGENASIMKMGTEYWLNAILSGPITQTVNVLSNTLVPLFTPAEKIIQGVFTGNQDVVNGALKEYASMTEGYRAAFRMSADARSDFWTNISEQMRSVPGAQAKAYIIAQRHGQDMGGVWKSFMTGEAQLIKGADQFDIGDAAITARGIRGRYFNNGEDGPLQDGSPGAALVNGVGNLIRMPGRLLTTGDELAKTVNYHMALNRLSFEDALARKRAGTILTDEAFDNHMRSLVRDVPDHFQNQSLDDVTRTSYAEMDMLAKEQAMRNTFTDPLNDGTLGQSIQRAVVAHPYLRFAVPFVRTPVNLLKFNMERTPLVAVYTRRFRAARKAALKEGANQEDKVAYQAAKTRMFVGTGVYLGMYAAASSGVLTGNGPSNFDERTALRATGWQPYSVKITQSDGSTKYVSYNRSDPFGLFMGIAATASELMGSISENDRNNLAESLMAALAESLMSKSYFTGITAIVAALDRPDERLGAVVSNLGASFVPNFVSSINKTGLTPFAAPDGIMREADTLMQKIMAKTPGWSDSLAPRRNIFGEVISYAMGFGPDTFSPFQSRTSANDSVNKEIARLAKDADFGLNMGAYDSIGDIELTDSQRDRYIVLTAGDPNRNGSTLRDDIRKLIESNKYQAADDGPDGKQALIKRLIRKRRTRAQNAMKRADAALALAIKERRRRANLAKKTKLTRRAGQQGRSPSDILAALTTTPDKFS